MSRTEYYGYLKRFVGAGFGERVMYGSDVGLDEYGEGIRAIIDADFLTKAGSAIFSTRMPQGFCVYRK